ncbi:ATP-binding protein [Streptomyces sp. P38-E01]|uniref:ATP-binding protein n=1 Tax=Streptomyces tardus TaxID=2780544 RepID=A0A949JAX5_9ACTN|nr:ATP-binding protein [Streptomyces tardus]MBU7596702.1 ATP-binding protein [Streptomyces tardus]
MTDSARVILLTGPSGSGKSSLAARTGLPVLRLDDFYKNAGDPSLPTFPDGATDWDSPLSWDADAAIRAVRELCAHGTTTAPVYDISVSAQKGTAELDLGGSPLFVAEGIFAAQIAARCAEDRLLADALCLRGRPTTTFRRRLVRDVREGRKSLPVLLRRGWRLMRAEPRIVRELAALGARPCGKREALAAIAAAEDVRSTV